MADVLSSSPLQVIYALNTKNDEHEAAIATLKEAHEEEVQQILSETREKILQVYTAYLMFIFINQEAAVSLLNSGRALPSESIPSTWMKHIRKVYFLCVRMQFKCKEDIQYY